MVAPLPSAPVQQTCYRHPDQPAGVICQRCDRPICPKCMHQASVGFHCPECTKAGAQKVYRGPAALATRPIATIALIVANCAIFAVGVLISGSEAITDASSRQADDFALFAGYIEAGEYYRLITSGFIHFGFLHLALNMWVLWIFGQAMENLGSRARFAAVYVTSILAGSLGALIVDPDKLSAGASGAIFGLAGALLLAQRARGVPISRSPLLLFLVLNFAFSLAIPNVSFGGHMGGFIGGAITGWAFYDLGDRPNTKPWLPWVITVVTALVLVGASIQVSVDWVDSVTGGLR